MHRRTFHEDEVATALRHRISGHPRTISHLPSVKHVINKRGHHVGEVEERRGGCGHGGGVIHFSLLQYECVALHSVFKWGFSHFSFVVVHNVP